MNMAIDEAIMKACIRQKNAPATLRFYSWSPPAISIGCLQKISDNFDFARIEKSGLDAVRRPTGGRIVLHKGDLTYSLVFAEKNPLIPRGILPSYQKISQAIQQGFVSLGVPARLCPERKINRSPFCFSLVAKYEILVHEKKIMGNAQKRDRGVVLQQGSIMMENHQELIHQLFPPDTGTGGEEFTSMEELLNGSITFSQVKDALIRGFEEVLNISLVSGSLTDWEEEEAIRLCREKYSQDRWNKEGHV